MKVSIKSPKLDLEIDDVKKLEDVLDFIAGLKKLESDSGAEMDSKKPPPKKK